MGALNLRDVPADLLANLKAKAAASNTTLRDYCIQTLAESLAQPETAQQSAKTAKEGSPKSSNQSKAKPRESREAANEAKQEANANIGTPHLLGPKPTPETIARTAAEIIASHEYLKDRHHDPTNCRIYRCGLCAVIKAKTAVSQPHPIPSNRA